MSGAWVRPAVIEDVGAVAAVHVEAWAAAYLGLIPPTVIGQFTLERREAQWRQAIARDPPVTSVTVGGTGQGAIAGFAAGGPSRSGAPGSGAEIYAIYVLPAAQRSGLGRALMRGLAAQLIGRGMRSAGLWVLRDNAPAMLFYERLGARAAAKRSEFVEGTPLEELWLAWDDIRSLARC